MLKICRIAAALAVTWFLTQTSAVPADQGVDLYETAVRTMATLPMPAYIAYRMEGQSDTAAPMRVSLINLDNLVWLDVAPGRGRITWDVLHRTRDFANVVAEYGTPYYTKRSFFDITWDGAYHELHDGILFHNGIQPTPKPMPTSTTQPSDDCGINTIASVSVPGAYTVRELGSAPRVTPSAAPSNCGPAAQIPLDPRLRTIAFLHVMGPAVYRQTDTGPAECENGDPGRMLHFTPRYDPQAHQLTDAIVDVQLMRFCMLRFKEPIRGASVEQHYNDVHGYWVQTDGVVWDTFDMPVPGKSFQPNLGFPTAITGDYDTYREPRKWVYQIQSVDFPSNVPDDSFGTHA
jgi:hypothetical protein